MGRQFATHRKFTAGNPNHTRRRVFRRRSVIRNCRSKRGSVCRRCSLVGSKYGRQACYKCESTENAQPGLFHSSPKQSYASSVVKIYGGLSENIAGSRAACRSRFLYCRGESMGMTKLLAAFLRFWPSNSITEHPSKIELPLVIVSPVPQVSISLAPAPQPVC